MPGAERSPLLLPTEQGADESNDPRSNSNSSPDEEESSVYQNNKISKLVKYLCCSTYEPNPDDRSFLDRLQSQTATAAGGGVTVKVAVLTAAESRRYFGVSLTPRGLQAVYVEIDNNSDTNVFLNRVRIDPNYFSATEAAALCRLASPKTLLEIGFVSALLFLPLALLLPLKLLTAISANRRMEQFFRQHSLPLGICPSGQVQRGFIYTSLEHGEKMIPIELIVGRSNSSTSRESTTETLVFTVPLSDLAVDFFHKKESVTAMATSTPLEPCSDLDELREYLERAPRAVTNRKGTKEGDPLNLVVIGDFETVLATFTGARWDETETINLKTCTKMVQSFLFGSEYRYSPVSALYLHGRPQDFALQRARDTINERLHLRLWWTPRVWEGKTVWIGQVSRDIGVKLAMTWNLTTHRIDPAVDEARDYVLSALLETERLTQMGLVGGVGESNDDAPRRNLGGDPYVTDGQRVVLILAKSKTKSKLIEW